MENILTQNRMYLCRFFKVQVIRAVQHFTRPLANMFLLLSGELPRIYTQHNDLFTFEFHMFMKGFHIGKLPMRQALKTLYLCIVIYCPDMLIFPNQPLHVTAV